MLICYRILYDFLFSVPAESLKDLRVQIPETVLRGHNAVFNCTFKFDEDETLYAIKWYRGTYEIFRYIPSDDPPTKSFPLAGYNVNVSIQSILTQCYLSTRNSYDPYKVPKRLLLTNLIF